MLYNFKSEILELNDSNTVCSIIEKIKNHNWKTPYINIIQICHHQIIIHFSITVDLPTSDDEDEDNNNNNSDSDSDNNEEIKKSVFIMYISIKQISDNTWHIRNISAGHFQETWDELINLLKTG